jgi:hypothetical protein
MAAIIGKSMLDSGAAEKDHQGHFKNNRRKKKHLLVLYSVVSCLPFLFL